MSVSSMNGASFRSNGTDKIKPDQNGLRSIPSYQTNFQLSPSEDKISFINNGLEIHVHDVATMTLEAKVEFKEKILSHVAIYQPHRVTIFSGDERGNIWTWNSKSRDVVRLGYTLITHPILGLWYNKQRELLVAFDKYIFTVFSIMNGSIFASLQVVQNNPTGAYVDFARLGSRMITYCYEAQKTQLQKLVLWNLTFKSKITEKNISLVGTPQVHQSWLIARTTDGDVEIWGTKQGAIVKIIAPFINGISDIQPSGQFLFITEKNWQGFIKVFDLATGVCKSTTPLEDDCVASKTGIDPTGRFFVVVKDLDTYVDEGKGFLQIYKIEESDVTFVKSVSSEKHCPIKIGPLLAFSSDGNQVCVSCDIMTQQRTEDTDAASDSSTDEVSFVLFYDIAKRKKVYFAPHQLGKNQRLLKTESEKGKIFIENLTSPQYIQFNSTLGSEALSILQESITRQ